MSKAGSGKETAHHVSCEVVSNVLHMRVVWEPEAWIAVEQLHKSENKNLLPFSFALKPGRTIRDQLANTLFPYRFVPQTQYIRPFPPGRLECH